LHMFTRFIFLWACTFSTRKTPFIHFTKFSRSSNSHNL
jgi:hypothetical protein